MPRKDNSKDWPYTVCGAWCDGDVFCEPVRAKSSERDDIVDALQSFLSENDATIEDVALYHVFAGHHNDLSAGW